MRADLIVLVLLVVVAVVMLSQFKGLIQDVPPKQQTEERELQQTTAPLSAQGSGESLLNSMLPDGVVHYVAVDDSGAVWMQYWDEADQEDRVFKVEANGRPTSFPDLRSAVAANYADIAQGDSVANFWAVDQRQRVWVGPAYYDGSRWHNVADDVIAPEGGLVYEDRAMTDGLGRVWVPYRVMNDCPFGADCTSVGLQSFDIDGKAVDSIVIEDVAERQRYDLPSVLFTDSGSKGTMAVGPKAMYHLETKAAIPYPVEVQKAGFATEGLLNPEGLVEVFTTAEQITGSGSRSRVQTSVASNVWTGEGWSTRDLGSSPLFKDSGTGSARVAAAAYASPNEVWLASTTGEIAVQKNSAWAEHYTAENSPLDRAVHDLAVANDGTVWVGSAEGVQVHHEESDWSGSNVTVVEASKSGLSPSRIVARDGETLSVKLRNLTDQSAVLVFDLGHGRVQTGTASAQGVGYVNFQAPPVPGDYSFYITAPGGGARRMSGVLHIAGHVKTAVMPAGVKRGVLGAEDGSFVPQPGHVESAFGLGIDAESGLLVNQGTAFQYGTMFLCNVIRWSDLDPGTWLRQQWSLDNSPLTVSGLDDTATVEQRNGWHGACVGYQIVDTDEWIPLPTGVFRVDWWLDDISASAVPRTRAEAVIQEDPPPGATPVGLLAGAAAHADREQPSIPQSYRPGGVGRGELQLVVVPIDRVGK
jgi:hypothetical protein